MSRSYRKPWVTDGYKGSKRRQYYKRLANKVVRRAIGVPDGKAYRKFYDTWDICDFKFYADIKDEYWCEKPWHYNRK
jgi:hypothetical protein